MSRSIEKVILQLNKQFKVMEVHDDIELNETEQRLFDKISSSVTADHEDYDITLDIRDYLELPEEANEGEADPNEFSDPEVESPASSQQSQPSGSEYNPTPTTKETRPDDDYMAKSYNFWNKLHIDLLPVYTPPDMVPGGRRTFKSVQHKYNRLTSIQQLYTYERSVLRKPSIKQINLRTYEIFKGKRAEGAIVHDRHLQLWAMQVKKSLDQENRLQFKASKGWVLKFKNRFNLVSRKITNHVTSTELLKEIDIQNAAIEFTLEVSELIEQMKLQPHQVINIDQSKFEKELHSRRTLEEKGRSNVRAVVGSVYATKHSYCIMPIISMDGTLHKTLYVLVSEPSGSFPSSKAQDPANIRSFASKTSQMSKKDMEDFYKDVFWPCVKDSTPPNILLLLDSWSSNKDEDLFLAHKPALKEVDRKFIPPGTTGYIQPLDVYFFRPYKNFIKFVTDSVILETDYKVWHRDEFIKLQSLAHFQFTAERFRGLIRFAFYEAGYTKDEPEKCEKPVDFCFKNVDSNCCFKEQQLESESPCGSIGFLRCAHCTEVFCLRHSLIEKLHINCSQ